MKYLSLSFGAALALAIGCSSNDSKAPTNNAPVDSGAPDTSAPAVTALFDGECQSCVDSNCGAAATECAGDENCRKCLVSNDFEACHASDHIHELANTIWVCQANSCDSQCYGETGAPAASCKGYYTGTCGECMEANCCTQVTKCISNAVCKECAETGNEEVCHSQPQGHALFHALGSCSASKCKEACK